MDEIIRSQDPAGDGIFDSRMRIVRPDGETRWLHSRALTEFGEIEGERRAIFCTGSVTDITESKALEDERARSSAILDATPDLVSVSDLKGNPIYLNRAGRVFLGLAKGEEPSAEGMRAAYPEVAWHRLEEEGIPTAIRAGSWKCETEFLNAQGDPVPMSEVVIAHRGAAGEVEYISSIARDLSREKELEQQFLHAQKMEAVGRLAGGIA